MRTRLIACLLCLLAMVGKVHAQAPAAAQVPAPLVGHHSAFLAYAGAAGLGRREDEVTATIYCSMATAVGAPNRYRLVASPQAAELSLRVKIDVVSASVTNGDSFSPPYLQLAIYDTKTQSLLWVIDAPLRGAFRKESFEKNIAESTAGVMATLDKLIAGQLP